MSAIQVRLLIVQDGLMERAAAPDTEPQAALSRTSDPSPTSTPSPTLPFHPRADWMFVVDSSSRVQLHWLGFVTFG